jgi:hypothetical protein
MAYNQWPQPEQDSQANRTWSNIVENPTKPHCSENQNTIKPSQVAEDYIPLTSGGNGGDLFNRNGSKDGKQLKRKLPNNDKLQNGNSHISTSEFSLYCTPWKAKNYVQDPVGFVCFFPKMALVF